MTALSDAQAAVAAQLPIAQAASDLLASLRVTLKALEAQDLDDRDAEVASLVAAIEVAAGPAKAVLKSTLYARVMQGTADAGDDEIKAPRARARMLAALEAEDDPITGPLSVELPPGLGGGGRR